MRGVRWIGVVAVAAGLLLGGCGSDDDEGSAGSEPQQTESSSASGGGGGGGATVKLSATEFKFDPANPKVAKAGKVKFEVTNDGQTVHALEVEGPGGEVETEDIQPGDSATVTADLSKAGRFEMYCPIGNHRDQGMEGEVVVAGGGSGGAADDKGGEDKSEDDSGGGAGGGY